MAKNKLRDLNDHLFAQIERLSAEDLTPEQIDAEAKRGAAIVAAADQIIRIGDISLRAAKLVAEEGARVTPFLTMIAQDKSAGGAA